ncbi:MAG: FecR domain-containing protein [Pseudomonadota bacterium]
MAALKARYHQATKAAAVEWRLLVLDGELSPEEQEDFDEWLAKDPRHVEAYQHAADTWDALGTIRRDNLDVALFEGSEAGLARRALGFLKAPRFPSPGLIFPAAVAAIAVFMLALIIGSGNPQDAGSAAMVTAHETAKGQTRSVTLSDATEIVLGASTKLRVSMSEAERRVELLGGAAVFDVAADPERPFLVVAESLTVRVIGTVFDVRNNGGVVRVSVAEGTVEALHPIVISGTHSDMMATREMTVGQQLSASREQGLSTIASFPPEDFALWRSDRLKYAGATLRELIGDANRYSTREIVLDGLPDELANEKVAVSFSGEDIDGLLATLPHMFAVEVTEGKEGQILIRGKAER